MNAGFYHEHQRPNREKTVHFNCAALNPFCTSLPKGKTCCDVKPGANGCCKKKTNFDVKKDLEKNQIDATGTYDTTSIMHYVATAFAIKGKRTLVAARKGVKVPTKHNGVPSHHDITRLCKMYPGNCRKRPRKRIGGSETEEVEIEEIEEVEEFEEIEDNEEIEEIF